MKIKFLAKGLTPVSYNINGSLINGVDTSLFTEGSVFVGNEDTYIAGIYGMLWENGVLHVILGQMTKGYQIPGCCSDWWEGDWIDASDYDPEQCYVVATDPEVSAMLSAGDAEYWRDPADGRWTVRLVDKGDNSNG
ncbi:MULTISPECIES: hypothetical protein [unclassified Halomonas]|uniref:hypothetical protein n=1 Tax=unclassified Halomonas TaxID=2609666 RepID=UPI0020768D6C|nr:MULTISPECIES: hypothetical protein [unclassified Halomonas]